MATPPTPTQVNTAVFNGVEYIDFRQAANGSWDSNVPETAAAIIAYGTLDRGNIVNLPTHVVNPANPAQITNMQTDLTNAVAWLLSQQDTTDVPVPNGVGGSWPWGGLQTYSTGLALAALSFSASVPTVPANAVANAIALGRTFLMNEFQGPPNGNCSANVADPNFAVYCGGWNYDAGIGRSDASNTGFAMTGLQLTGGVPVAIQAVDEGFQNNDQSLKATSPFANLNDGGGGYQPGSGGDFQSNANDSGSMLFGYAYDGVTSTDPRVDAAIQFDTDVLDTYEKAAHSSVSVQHSMVFHTGLNEDGSCDPASGGCDWATAPGEGGFHYSMFTLSKGLGAYLPPDLSDGTNWYAKEADLLVTTQDTNTADTAFGSWPVDGRDDYTGIFATGLSVFALGLVAVPPPPVVAVTAVVASASCTTVTLNWTNPNTPNFGGVWIQRSTTAVPASPTDGTRVADVAAPGATFTDTGLTAGVTYHYALFAHDTTGSAFAQGADIDATPECSTAQTTITVSSSANPSVFGQPVTLTATVAPVAPATGTPMGSVQFFDGTTPIGSGTLNGGTPDVFSITTSTLSVGTHHITANYAGQTSLFFASNSAVFDQVVKKAATSTALAAAPPGSAGFGNQVTFTATVAPVAPGAGTPTGLVVFTVDGATVGTRTLNAAEQASIATSSLSPGGHVIGAAYQGDGNFKPSSTTLAYLITCGVTITGFHPGAVIVTGTVCIVNANVTGAVVVQNGGSVAIENSTIGGSITAVNHPRAIQICGSTIGLHVGGAVDVVGDTQLVMVGDPNAGCAVNNIGGTLILRDNHNGVEAIGNTVGNLLASNNSGPGPYPGDTTMISGNIIVGRH